MHSLSAYRELIVEWFVNEPTANGMWRTSMTCVIVMRPSELFTTVEAAAMSLQRMRSRDEGMLTRVDFLMLLIAFNSFSFLFLKIYQHSICRKHAKGAEELGSMFIKSIHLKMPILSNFSRKIYNILIINLNPSM